MHLDVTNTTAGSSRISSNISGTAAYVALNNYPVGISRPDGMLGRTMYTTSNCAGVAGTCENATGGVGVMATAKSATGVGLYGFAGSVVPSTLGPAGTGVYGAGPNQGVVGKPTTSGGTGVWGQATSAIGVLGQSVNGGGVFGDGTGAGAYGVFGRSTDGAAIMGSTTSGFAGLFNGAVSVTGSFTVSGGPKSAAVPFPDGSHRRMYCQESPEPWFEDFGTALLKEGQAEVVLAGDFVSVVKGDDYIVVPIPEGDCKGLFVSKKGGDRFYVQELQGGKSTLTFSYRVVSRRREEVGKRLEKVNLSTLKPGFKMPGPVGPEVGRPDPEDGARDEPIGRQ
jgi:hypothetical protein